MNKSVRKIIIFISCMLMIGSTAAYAYFSDSLTVTNRISTGDVNIQLAEYQKKGRKEVLFSNDQTVLPGDVISKIPRITNLAMPCWVRVKIDYQGEQENAVLLGDEQLLGILPEWIKRGEYFYYTNILKKAESVDVFQGLSIPEEWEKEHESQNLKLIVKAEAIQAANFLPDFTAMSPWGDQPIELCVHEANGDVICRKENAELSVTFHGAAHRLIAVPEDFFSNFGTIMPGDLLSDTLEISNTTNKDAEILFRVETKEQSEKPMQILNETRLQIKMNGKNLYSGNVMAASLGEGVSLGRFSPKEAGKLEFMIEVPREWNNSYALQNAEIDWIFTVYEEENAENAIGINRDSSQIHEFDGKKSAKVKTGDDTPIIPMVMVLCFTGILLFVILKIRKRSKIT